MSLFKSKTKTIILAGFLAGTLDILCAIFILGNGNATAVFRYIAKGAFGDRAFQAGSEMIIYGILFHYFIGFCFTMGYFFCIPHMSFFRNRKIVSGLLYGVFVWASMQFLVLPLTYNSPAELTLENMWKNILILMFAFGLPIAILAEKYYREPQTF